MRNYIILIFTIAGALWFADRYSSLSGWEWVIQIGFGALIGWAASSVILKASGDSRSSKHTEKIIGTISNIGYSSIRINNMPRLKITVRYKGTVKDFEPIDPDVQFSLKIGSKAVIYVNPENVKDAYFDKNQSIELNT